MPKLWVIGDIHGFSLALDRILEQMKIEKEDTVVTLGDYIDRGPDARGVLERLLRLKKECHLVTLRGNHEDMLLTLLKRELDGTLRPSFWKNFMSKKPQLEMADWLDLGGRQTLASYGMLTTRISQILPTHIEFMKEMPLFYETEKFIFTHAAYIPELEMADQPTKSLLYHRLRVSIPEKHISGKTFYVGHSAQHDGKILDRGHIICIDTYLYGGGWLTARELMSGETIQVDAAGRRRK
ncbi:MAG: metallophosphoesterase family protein [Planctomycetia bacterium]|nr:metallophosphoesterase family protein [Planctomycetia bacterium]